jgi:hypothetical protein
MVNVPLTVSQHDREADMAEMVLTLNAEERQYLVNLLEKVLKDTQIEEHRTRKLSYRESILHQEAVIHQLLEKVRQCGN